MIVHVLRHRIVLGHEVEFTSYLRHVGLDAAIEAPGIVAVYAGRRLAHHRKEHVAVSVWGGAESAARGITDGGLPRFLVPIARVLDEVDSRSYDCELADHERGAEARVIRVCRRVSAIAAEPGEGRADTRAVLPLARPNGCVGAWVGTLNTVFSMDGVPGPEPSPDPGHDPEHDREHDPGYEAPEFVAVSVWRGWDALTAATRGRLTNPLAALGERRTDQLRIGHFDVVPNGFRE